jgi:hypothetical protein
VTIDGHETIFADKPLSLVSWAPVPEARRVAGGAVLQARIQGEGVVRIPAIGLPEKLAMFAEGPTPGSRGEAVPCRLENGALVFTTTPTTTSRWLYVCGG